MDDVGSLPAPLDSLLAWAVREGITNVIRHSRAVGCEISLQRALDSVRPGIRDDGRGVAADASARAAVSRAWPSAPPLRAAGLRPVRSRMAASYSRCRHPSRILKPELSDDPSTIGRGSGAGARECEVLTVAADGATLADVAVQLGLSEGAVRNHLSVAIQKLGVRNRIEAARIAERKGWLWMQILCRVPTLAAQPRALQRSCAVGRSGSSQFAISLGA